MSEIPESAVVSIRTLARFLGRFARDDRVELVKDLEMAGWIRYLEFEGKPVIWLHVKYAMMKARNLWQFGVTICPLKDDPSRRFHAIPGPRFFELSDERKDGNSLTPEKILDLKQQAEQFYAIHTEWKAGTNSHWRRKKPRASHCSKGHLLNESWRQCKICLAAWKAVDRQRPASKEKDNARRRTPEFRAKQRQVRAANHEREMEYQRRFREKRKAMKVELDLINVLNLELQKEIVRHAEH